jgi:hypothetical protein
MDFWTAADKAAGVGATPLECHNANYGTYDPRTGKLGDSLFVKKLLAAGLSRTHVNEVLAVMQVVCRECWNAEGRCYCARDE